MEDGKEGPATPSLEQEISRSREEISSAFVPPALLHELEHTVRGLRAALASKERGLVELQTELSTLRRDRADGAEREHKLQELASQRAGVIEALRRAEASRDQERRDEGGSGRSRCPPHSGEHASRPQRNPAAEPTGMGHRNAVTSDEDGTQGKTAASTNSFRQTQMLDLSWFGWSMTVRGRARAVRVLGKTASARLSRIFQSWKLVIEREVRRASAITRFQKSTTRRTIQHILLRWCDVVLQSRALGHRFSRFNRLSFCFQMRGLRVAFFSWRTLQWQEKVRKMTELMDLGQQEANMAVAKAFADSERHVAGLKAQICQLELTAEGDSARLEAYPEIFAKFGQLELSYQNKIQLQEREIRQLEGARHRAQENTVLLLEKQHSHVAHAEEIVATLTEIQTLMDLHKTESRKCQEMQMGRWEELAIAKSQVVESQVREIDLHAQLQRVQNDNQARFEAANEAVLSKTRRLEQELKNSQEAIQEWEMELTIIEDATVKIEQAKLAKKLDEMEKSLHVLDYMTCMVQSQQFVSQEGRLCLERHLIDISRDLTICFEMLVTTEDENAALEASTKAHIQTLNSEKNRLEMRVQSSEQEIESRAAQALQLKGELKAMQDEAAGKLKADKEKYEQLLDEIKNTHKLEMEEMEQHAAAKEADLCRVFVQERREFEQKINLQGNQLEDLHKDLADLKQKKDAEILSLQEAVNEQKRHEKRLMAELQDRLGDVERYRLNQVDLKRQIDSLHATIKQLGVDAANMDAQMRVQEDIIKAAIGTPPELEVSILVPEIAQYPPGAFVSQLAASVKRKIEADSSRIESLQLMLERYQSEATYSLSTSKRHVKEIEDLRSNSTNLNLAFKTEMDKLKQELATQKLVLQAERQVAKSAEDEHKRKLSDARNEIQELKASCRNRETELENMREELSRCDHARQSLETEMHQLQQLLHTAVVASQNKQREQELENTVAAKHLHVALSENNALAAALEDALESCKAAETQRHKSALLQIAGSHTTSFLLAVQEYKDARARDELKQDRGYRQFLRFRSRHLLHLMRSWRWHSNMQKRQILNLGTFFKKSVRKIKVSVCARWNQAIRLRRQKIGNAKSCARISSRFGSRNIQRIFQTWLSALMISSRLQRLLLRGKQHSKRRLMNHMFTSLRFIVTQ